MLRSAVLSIAISVATVLVVPAQDQVTTSSLNASPSSGQPVPLTFIHVDNAGALGDSLASLIASQIVDLPTVVRQERADLVIWLRTIDFAAGTVPVVAYSVIVDYGGLHVTDNLGLSSSENLSDAADGLLSLIARLANELRSTGTIASLE